MTKEEITKDLSALDAKIELNRQRQNSLKDRYNEFVKFYTDNLIAKAKEAFDWDLMMKARAAGGTSHIYLDPKDHGNGYITGSITRDSSCAANEINLQFDTHNGYIKLRYRKDTDDWKAILDLNLSTKDNIEAINYNAKKVAPMRRISEDWDDLVNGIYATTKRFYASRNSDLEDSIKGCDVLMMPWEIENLKKEA